MTHVITGNIEVLEIHLGVTGIVVKPSGCQSEGPGFDSRSRSSISGAAAKARSLAEDAESVWPQSSPFVAVIGFML